MASLGTLPEVICFGNFTTSRRDIAMAEEVPSVDLEVAAHADMVSTAAAAFAGALGQVLFDRPQGCRIFDVCNGISVEVPVQIKNMHLRY